MKKTPPISDEDRQLFRDTIKNIRCLNTIEKNISPRNPLTYKRKRTTESNITFTENPDEPSVLATEQLRYATSGVRQNTLRKLKRGQFYIDDSLDLHGMTIAQPKHAMIKFLTSAQTRQYQCVHIIHGKSHHTLDKPKLKNAVNQWLRQYPAVLAFCSATPQEGGAGAIYVLLK